LCNILPADFVVVDDYVGFGGTLVNLCRFTEQNGGAVLVMTTRAETPEARQIAIRSQTLNMLHEKHGSKLADFWNPEFGHGLDCLPNIEGEYLCRVESIAAIKTRMAQTVELARGRGLSPVSLDGGP